MEEQGEPDAKAAAAVAPPPEMEHAERDAAERRRPGVPAGQGKGADEPAGQKEPTGHGVGDECEEASGQ